MMARSSYALRQQVGQAVNIRSVRDKSDPGAHPMSNNAKQKPPKRSQGKREPYFRLPRRARYGVITGEIHFLV